MGSPIERSSNSPMTSTSHTMTALPSVTLISHSGPPRNTRQSTDPSPYEALIANVQPENRYSFLTPSKDVNEVAVQFGKSLLDGLACKIHHEQKTRFEAKRQEGKGKRKRAHDAHDGRELLQIKKIVTEGFATDPVWQQTRRVVDALHGEVERQLEELNWEDQNGSEKIFNAVEDVVSSGDEVSEDEGETTEEESDGKKLAAFDAHPDQSMSDFEDEKELEDGEELEDEKELEDEDKLEDDSQNDEHQHTEVYVEDKHGLNDGFFSIDEFNRQTEFLERQGDLAEPLTGEVSDEEEIDWDADPITNTQLVTSSSRGAQAIGIDDEEEDDEGPTFGNADLNAPFSDDDDNEDEEDSMEEEPDALGTNTNDILYADFFAPPPRKASKGERQASYLARQASKSKPSEKDEVTELERAQASQRRDLFDDESVASDSDASTFDPGDPKSRKSAHERRQAKLLAEIQRLEAASVEKRDWTLAGEAKASDRAKNSLAFLDDELDFERTGKPVPVITAEVSESIEELIKRRILARDFDEVVKRRPDTLGAESGLRRGALELSDEKSTKGLGELYADEHVQKRAADAADGTPYVSHADEQVQRQRAEVTALWADLAGRLDALSSWHYRPRPPAPAITVVADVPTVCMEDAQPGTGAAVAGAAGMLAPQEIYAAGRDRGLAGPGEPRGGEEVVRGGVPVARAEMTREEKLRRRRRAKERLRKGGGGGDVVPGAGGKKSQGPAAGRKAAAEEEKREVVGQLKRGGVLVIDRKGELVDVAGKKAAVGKGGKARRDLGIGALRL